ncbi:hypothetical protein [Paraconexibacter algicola]|uniref:Uncharacterized protein n=1 Tax=Paraconexibacter algicola TaxID=2133960 RepID=A0A2T4UIS4_9ACTN|nr:hypothetical protein [Paraconexibacter algicola]PTL59129.1 hypothetical protein C7Y72_05430 [Paraconexibacter algicola]
MFRLLFSWPALLTRALDDFHQLVATLKKMEDVGRISKDIRDLNTRLASTEAVLRDIARPAKTTDTIMRAMPGSKVVASRAKAQRERAKAARPSSRRKPADEA